MLRAFHEMNFVLVPIYIFLCIVLGGSVQGIWGNFILQILAILLIAWSLITQRELRVAASAKPLLLIVGAVLALIAIQLVPLPPAVWGLLPGREFIAEGFRLLGQPLPWLPISLTPYETLVTAFYFHSGHCAHRSGR